MLNINQFLNKFNSNNNIVSKIIISLFLIVFTVSFTENSYSQEYCSLNQKYTNPVKSFKQSISSKETQKPKPKTYKVASNNQKPKNKAVAANKATNKPKQKQKAKTNNKNIKKTEEVKDNATIKRNPVWLLFNYNHPVNGKDFNASKGYGSINFNVGYNIWKMFSIELYIGGRMSNDQSSRTVELMGESQSNGHIYKTKGEEVTKVDYSLFDFGATILLQPKFEKKYVNIMPYIGIGPLFSYSKASYDVYTNYNNVGPNVKYNISDNGGLDTSFDVGMKVKGGVRFNMVKNLMFGLNLEYIYIQGKNFSKKDLDLSTFSIGFEFGTTF